MFTRIVVISSFVVLVLFGAFDFIHAEENSGTISVTGKVQRGYPPDTVKVVFSVETTEEDVLHTVEKNTKKAEMVIAGLKGLLDTSSGDTLKTSSYTIHPVYEYNRKEGRRVLVGYKVENQITVETKKEELAGRILAVAIESGANRVQGINYSLFDIERFCKDLLTEAAKKARNEASIVAGALGENVGACKKRQLIVHNGNSTSSHCDDERSWRRSRF